MLERAGPCFKAGARDSLRCATVTAHHGKQKVIGKTPRSQRQLHQQFWTHGAGDLGLNVPPLAIPATPPRDLPLRHDRQTRAVPSDGIFLDFLYPPQALAWLNGANGYHREPWERRNARRLPEGFIQASRGYSSRSHVRMAQIKTPEQEQEQAPAPGRHDADADFLDGLERAAVEHNPETHHAGSNGIDNAEVGHLLQETMEPAPDIQSDDGELASPFISAGHLAEQGGLTPSSEEGIAQLERAATMDGDIFTNPYTVGSDDPQERLMGLRRILNTNPHHAKLESVPRTWKLFLSLDSDEKDDVRLKEKLLSWLVETDHEHVPAYTITLLWTIPQEKRTLQLYQLAARPLLPPAKPPAKPKKNIRINNTRSIKRMKLDDPSNQPQDTTQDTTQKLAETLHDEAVSHLPNVSQLSFIMFSAAMQGCSWHQALRVFEASASQASTQQHELFLLKISEAPNLLHAVDLLRRHLKPMSETERARWVPMWVHSAKEVIQHSFQPRVPEDFMNKRPQLYAILFFLSLWGPEQVDFFRGLLAHRLKIVNEYAESSKLLKLDTWSITIISRVYKYYRELPGAKLDEDLLQILLRLRCNSLKSTTAHANIDSHGNVSVGLLANDWQRWHTKIGLDGVHTLLAFAANVGDVDTFASWSAYLERNYPEYQDRRPSFWARIHVHALAGNLESAQRAFDEVQSVAISHGDKLDRWCWQSLIRAYQRVADLEGAFSTLQSAIHNGHIIPTASSFDGVARMLGTRGEVKAVNDLVKQYKRLSCDSQTRNWQLSTQITALCAANKPQEAEEMLTEVLKGKLLGNPTPCCNVLLSFHARNRNIDATMRIYRWMKTENMKLNGASYRHLLTVLAEFRQASAAWVILKTVMQAEGCPPDASHYAVVMYGYLKTAQLDKVHLVYKRMLNKQIRPNLDVKRWVMKAALVADRRKNAQISHGQSDTQSLVRSMRTLQTIVKFLSGKDLASTAETHGQSVADRAADLFASVISECGRKGFFKEAKQLFEQSKSLSEKLGLVEWPTLRIHTSWMRALACAKEFEQVEAYWRVVKKQGDRLAHTSVLDIQNLEHRTTNDYRPNALIIEPSSPDSRAELGFSNDVKPVQALPEIESVGRKDYSHLGPRPAPARRYLLTNAFQVYMDALREQGRIADMVGEFTHLIAQGYAFHNVLWNKFIEYICVSNDPPLALLAFTLTERYLMANFPGWRMNTWVGADGRRMLPTTKAERAEGMEYMKARYFSYLQLVPKYRTMLNLARALIDIRRLEAAGMLSAVDASGSTEDKLKRFVGSMREIQEKAPKTLAAVMDLPRVDDKWQNRLLRDQGWTKEGGNPRRRINAVARSGILSLPPLAEDANATLDAIRRDTDAFNTLDGETDGTGYMPFGGALKADGDESADVSEHDAGFKENNGDENL